MDFRFQEDLHRLQSRVLKLHSQLPEWRYFDSDENISFAVLADSGLEKFLEDFCRLSAGELLKTIFYFFMDVHGSRMPVHVETNILCWFGSGSFHVCLVAWCFRAIVPACTRRRW